MRKLTKMSANGASDKVDMDFAKMDKLNSVLLRLDNPKITLGSGCQGQRC